jgi:hypothetical protein
LLATSGFGAPSGTRRRSPLPLLPGSADQSKVTEVLPMAWFEEILKKYQVTCLDAPHLVLRCDQCGEVWTPRIRLSGRLFARSWRCPRGCNRSGTS